VSPGRRRTSLAAGSALLIAALLAPAPASAHGLVGRKDLPIPQWLFGWGAAVVLIVSFVALATLWPKPRLQQPDERPLFHLGRWADVIAGVIGVVSFVAVVYAGFAGIQVPATANLNPTFIYVIFWVGLVPASLLFGDVFRALSPWRAIARAVSWVGNRFAGDMPAPLPYPKRLGRWPAVLGILGFATLELVIVPETRTDPSTLSILSLVYAAWQLLGMSVYGIEAWSRNGDGFGVYYGLFARLSPLSRREDGTVVARTPLSGLPTLDTPSGTTALLIVAIGSTAFDGAQEGPLWTSIAPHLLHFFLSVVGAHHQDSGLELTEMVGLLLAILIVAGIYRLGVIGMKTLRSAPPRGQLSQSFAHTLVPISAAYVLAHYFSLLAYQGQAVAFLASDPLGHGSNIFGTASASINYNWINATSIWYVQVGALVIGHVAGLMLAHDRALTVFRNARQATRSQYWMLVVMVGFTSLGLWLLSSSNG
jgi:hypothetical protein